MRALPGDGRPCHLWAWGGSGARTVRHECQGRAGAGSQPQVNTPQGLGAEGRPRWNLGARGAQRPQEKEGSGRSVWEAGSERPWISEEPPDGGSRGSQGPPPPGIAAGVRVRVPVSPRGTERWPPLRGTWEPTVGTQCAGRPEKQASWRLRRPPGVPWAPHAPLPPLPSSRPLSEQLGQGLPWKMLQRRPRGPGPLCFRGKQLSGNLPAPEARPTLGLWGWDGGGGGLSREPETPRAGACRRPSSGVRGSHQPLPPALPHGRRAGVPPTPTPRGRPGLWAPSTLLCWQTRGN